MHHLFESSLILALLSGSLSASPLAKRNGDYSKIYREAVGYRNGTRAMLNTINKYGWTAPVRTKSNIDTNVASPQTNEKPAPSSGSGIGFVIATPEEHNAEYLCPVTIGGQSVNMNIDTGSSDLWVFNTGLSESDKINRTLYDPSKSKTFQNIAGATFAVNYGDGSQTYGNVGVDHVQVGGITVMGQAVELPTEVSSGFTSDLNSDGILGLAFQSTNGIKPEPQPTFFENSLSTLKAPVFTANLKADTAGNYQFGVIDHTAYSGSLNYIPVDKSRGLWEFQTKKGHSPGVADTGSSLLLLDDDIVNGYWSQVSGNKFNGQGIVFPCGSKLPDFKIELGPTYVATVAGSLIDYAPTAEPGYCFGGIQSNHGQELNIFGDILFASQFAVFDVGNTQIGFAPHAA